MQKQGCSSSNLLEQTCGVLTDLHEAHDDIVEVNITQSGVVFTLPSYLVQQQIPAVHGRQEVLVFSAYVRKRERERDES